MHLRWPLAAVVLAVLLPFGWCFGSTLTGARVCAYRDAASFYYPLYAWISRSWMRGEVPRWNPQEGLGTPVVGEATSAVFYPGQLIFALPIGYSLSFSLYIAAHVLLAAGGAFVLASYLLARGPGAERIRSPSPEGGASRAALCDQPDASTMRLLAAGLCGLSYAFSGAVLFQYCNMVFLVGAAWLPVALWAALRMVGQRSRRWALGLGVCLAMMVLGGDPQAAYHAGLLAALWAWFQRHEASPPRRSSPVSSGHRGDRPTVKEWGRHGLLLLATAAISGVCLSAVQIVPAVYWTTQSDRSAFQYPRNIYEVPAYAARGRGGSNEPISRSHDAGALDDAPATGVGIAKGLVGRPQPNTHHQQIYAFSVAPWRLVEYLWPNFSGRMFPRNQRWLAALRGEDRVWTPTLYLGLLPLLVALVAWRLRSGDRRIRWLCWIACGSWIASFGWYGPGWAWGVLQGAWTGEPPSGALGEPTGGLFWLMVTMLPGYAYFRYPAKLLVIASLAIALLAALGFERVLTSERDKLRRLLAVGGITSSVAVGVLAICGWGWSSWLAGSAPDELYGPLDKRGAWLGCLAACTHAAVICGLFWWLFKSESWPPVRRGMLVLIVTAVELGWANGSSVLTVPTAAMEAPSAVDGLAGRADETVRIYRPPERRWVPPEWSLQSEAHRGEATVLWDRATLLPKHHLLGSLGSVDSLNTLASRDYRVWLVTPDRNRPHPIVLQALSTRYLILPEGEDWPAAFARPSATAIAATNARLWVNEAPLPRIWIVHQVECWPRNESSDPEATRHRFRTLLFPDDRPRNLRQEAVVETDSLEASGAVEIPPTWAPRESCRLISEHACQVVVEAELSSPGLIVLSTLYDPGWAVEVITLAEISGAAEEVAAKKIVRTNGVMQGVFLRAGRHRLTFHYAPRHLYWAGAVSGVGWLGLLGLSIWRLGRRPLARATRAWAARRKAKYAVRTSP